ncbi:Hint domain-containing protein [Pseudorhodobacter wandonensis]|uniref:Hint domain-containing protein n=1 Tax=Pseudorhodobacter wandonensis TaxID=1120568 RepID=UPI00067DEEEA|nr:Hint domain-containing protein [Pseudorhodobacter wandonensis]
MGTGIYGTFVISWAQTETDGLMAAPMDVLAVGATWRWMGEPVRVDGAKDVLLLSGAEGAAELRLRAARKVRRLLGAEFAPNSSASAATDIGNDLPEQGFIVTDGRQSYTITLIDVPGSGSRLLMLVGELPPANQDLWVVRTAVDLGAQVAEAEAPAGVICFTPGTTIRGVNGPRLVENLRVGDFIATKDNGLQKILWIGTRRISGARLHAMPHLRPVWLRAGALGLDRPEHDLLVSPQHRMLVQGAAAMALFNTPEVLVAAHDLINDTSIFIDQTLRDVTYIHILLENHQVIWANGLETESFHPSNTALDNVAPDQRQGLLQVLPGLADTPQIYGDYARRNLSGPEAAILRHALAA